MLSLVFNVTSWLSKPSKMFKYCKRYSFSRGDKTEEDIIDLNSVIAFVNGFWFFFLYFVIISSINGTWYPVALDILEQFLSCSPRYDDFLSGYSCGQISKGKCGDWSFKICLYLSLILLSVLLLKSLLKIIRVSKTSLPTMILWQIKSISSFSASRSRN